MGRGEGKVIQVNTVKIPFAATTLFTGLLPSCPPAGPLGTLTVIWLLPCLIKLPVLWYRSLWRQCTCPTISCQELPERDIDLLVLSQVPLLTQSPLPILSPAASPVPGHSFKLMVPAWGSKTTDFLRGNFIWKVMDPQAMPKSKQTNKKPRASRVADFRSDWKKVEAGRQKSDTWPFS